MQSHEMRQRGGRMHAFQVWVNLPSRDKMTAPRYQEIPRAARVGGREVKDGQLAMLGDGNSVRVEVSERAQALLLTGVPLREPVVQYGPFVMNSEREIAAAYRGLSGRTARRDRKNLNGRELINVATKVDTCGDAEDGTELSAGIVDVFSGEVVNAADFGSVTAPAATAQPDLPERAMGRRWLAVAATALVTAYVAQVVVPAAETSPAPIAGIAPSYGPKTVSAVPNRRRSCGASGCRNSTPATTRRGSRLMMALFTSPPIAATASASVAGRAG